MPRIERDGQIDHELVVVDRVLVVVRARPEASDLVPAALQERLLVVLAGDQQRHFGNEAADDSLHRVGELQGHQSQDELVLELVDRLQPIWPRAVDSKIDRRDCCE